MNEINNGNEIQNTLEQDDTVPEQQEQNFLGLNTVLGTLLSIAAFPFRVTTQAANVASDWLLTNVFGITATPTTLSPRQELNQLGIGALDRH